MNYKFLKYTQMKKFNYFSILRQGKLFLLALLAWFTMQPAWSQTTEPDYLCFTAEYDGTQIALKTTDNPDFSKIPNIALQYRIGTEGTWHDWSISQTTTTTYYKYEYDYWYGSYNRSGNGYSGYTYTYVGYGRGTYKRTQVNSWNDHDEEKTVTYKRTSILTLSEGEKVYIRAKSTNPAFAASAGFSAFPTSYFEENKGDEITGNYWYFQFSKSVDCNGNIMSLLDKDCTRTDVPDYAFVGLFKNCQLLSAPALPATTLGKYCYYGMFFWCDALAIAPTLSATTLKDYCYAYMFAGCNSLQYLEVGFSEWHTNATKDWAIDVARWPSAEDEDYYFKNYQSWVNYASQFSSGGLFKGSSSLYKNKPTSEIMGTSRIPTGWTIEEYNIDYLSFTCFGNYTDEQGQTWIASKLNANIFFNETSDLYNVNFQDESKRVQLEYTLDGQNWTPWNYSQGDGNPIKISYGKTVSIRCANNDGYSTLSTDASKYYYFETKFDIGETEEVKVGRQEVSRKKTNGNHRGGTTGTQGVDWDEYEEGGKTQSNGQTAGENNWDYRTVLSYDRKGNPIYKHYFYTYYKNIYETRTKYLTDSEMASKYEGSLGVHGNVMSLIDNKLLKMDVEPYCFYRLFSGPNSNSMKFIFSAPNLPAEDLAQSCYESMFEGCAYLQTAPTLPATSTAIEESDAKNCYKQMFRNCTRLNSMNVGFDKWQTDNVTSFTENWVEGVTTENGSFLCPNGLAKEGGNSRIPTQWLSGSGTTGNVDDTQDWLCFTSNTDFATIRLDKSDASLKNLDGKLQYSLDGLTWKDYTWADKSGKIISLNAKNGLTHVYFRSTVTDNSGKCCTSDALYYQFKFSGTIEASGNIMSLLRKDCRRYSVGDYEFIRLFSFCNTLRTAPSLPATKLGVRCYERMFMDCTALMTPPELPATNLADYCYRWMFLRCHILPYAPELPAMTLKPYCYYQMFGTCKNLTAAPILPATDLADKCYEKMFLNCEKLQYINVYFSDWGSNTIEWVNGVSLTGEFYCPESLTKEYGISRIPYDNNNKWHVYDNTNVHLYFEAKRNGSTIQLNKKGTNLPSAIALLYSTDNGATWNDYTWNGTTGQTIALNKSGANRVFFKAGKTSDSNYKRNRTFSNDPNKAYYNFVMKGSFTANGSITSLLSQDLSLDTVPDNAFGRLFMDCSVMKTAPTLPAKTVGKSAYQYMFLRCKSMPTPPELPAVNLGNSCYFGMFMQCFNLTSAPELNATNLADKCYYQMFKNDTALTVAPTLPATELKTSCYQEMFRGCKNLQYMNVAFKNWNTTDATTNWVADGDDLAQYPFHNTGVFMCPKELAENPAYGPNRIPKNDTYKWYVNVAALRFTAENGGATIKLNKYGAPTNVTLQYSLDNAISWNELVFGEEIYVAKDQHIYIQAKNDVNAFSTSANDYYQFVIDGTMSVSGDVATLYNTSGTITSIPDYTFYKLFSGCAGLKNVPTLTRPNFPIGKYSHAYMFENCSSITEVPDSLALTLTEGCYKGMFKGCSSIKVAPVLPATTLVNNCYEELFYNCSNLQEINVGFTGWHSNATNNWVQNVSKYGIFFCPQNVANASFYASRIPYSTSYKWDVNPTFLKFTASTAASVELDRIGMPDTVSLVYSTDLHSWLNYIWNGEQGKKLNVAAGKSLYFRAKDTNATFSQSEEKYYHFNIEGDVAVSGYATYLLSKTNKSADVPAYGFYNLFKDCSTITSAPAPTANTNEWPTFNAHCYESMYEGCSSITTIPCELPSKQLNVACYRNMFKGCTNLTATMSTLPAQNLTDSCYEGMFEGCELITAAPNMAWTANPGNATFRAMFKGCKSLVDNLPNSVANVNVEKESCYESLFEGCESMNSKIDLPSNGLQKAKYKAMFKDCKSLTSDNLPELGFEAWAIANGESALESMFEGCESLTTPVVIRDVANWSQYPKAIMRKMFKGCTNLTTPLTLPLASIGEACFESMFEGCESLTKAPQLPQTNLAKDCYKRMFMGCTSLKRAPQLPAKTDQLRDSCYAYMFNGCTSLRYIDVAFNKWFDEQGANFDGATYMWVENVAPTGTFMCPFELNKEKVDASHIPSGWSTEDNGNYLYIAKVGGGNFDVYLNKQGNPNEINYQFSLDKKTWTSFSTDIWNNNKILTGDNTIVYIKCAEGVMSKDADNYWFFSTTGNVKIGGNITSLLDPTMEQTDVPDYAFYKLFSGCSNITDISELELPATELGAYAYAKMFDGCTTLKSTATATPELPATTLGAYCYQNLFEGWTALTSAPELPATTLEQGCYSGMFKGCTSLTTAPVLPATTLVNDCYDSLFNGCKKLNSINVAFTAWVEGATDNWVNDVAYSGDLLCPWSLAQSAKNKWVTGSNYDNAYGGSKIPRDKDHKWIILTHTDMEFNYRTGELSIAGGNTIYWSTDESLAFDNCTTVGTRVDSEPAIVDCNEWLSATTTGLDSITYYALALTGDDDGFTKPTVNSLTIYRHPKKIDMCICDTEEKIETALYYARKVSSANYPIKVFIADGEYDFGNKSIEVGEYVSVIGESLNGTILKSSSDKGALNIKGNDAYLQDMKLVNTGTGAAFTNKGQRTTLHVAMEGYYNEGGMSKHYLPEAWDRATDLTQATVTSASINGSTISLTSNAKYFLVRIDEKYSFASSKDFYIVESLAGKTVTIRAANNRGAFGEPITPNLIEPNGSKSDEFSVKLNGYGYSSFCFDDDNIDQLQVIGASVYKGIYRDGAVYLIRLNEHDIVPKRTGVILAGLQNSTVSFYENNSVVLSDEERNPYNYLPDEKCIGMSGNWSTETIVNNGHNYYVLSNNYGGFKPLKKDGGTIKPNKAYFDLGNSTNAATVRIVFGMWEDEEEEVVSGINYLPTTSNDSEYGYTLTGVRTKDAKGLVIQNNKVVLVK